MTGGLAETMRSEPAPHCLCCGVEGRVLYSALSDLLYGISGEWDVRQCEACGLLWLDPMPVASDIGLAYATYHTHASDAGVTHSSKLARSKGAARAAILSAYYGYRSHNDHGWIQPIGRALGALRPLRNAAGSYVMWLQAAPGARLLDVGCGNGRLLARLSGLGWSVSGVEPDREAAGVAAGAADCVVFPGDLLSAGFAADSLDAVISRHVIEHLRNPVEVLRECWRILKPGGELVVVTPNALGLGHRHFRQHWFGLDPPRHLRVFTPDSLLLSAEQAGIASPSLRTVASWARTSWRGSRLTQEAAGRPGDRVSDLVERTPTARQRLEAMGFYLLEELMLALSSEVGEEIVMSARKV